MCGLHPCAALQDDKGRSVLMTSETELEAVLRAPVLRAKHAGAPRLRPTNNLD